MTTATLGTSTVTVAAGDVLANLELLGDALVDFLQCQPHLQAKVTAAMLLSATPSAKAAESVSAKDVAKHREDVVHVHRCAAEAVETAATHRTGKSELVILLTLLRIVQHIIGLGSFFELFLGLLVTRVTVRVILDGYLSISLLDFLLRGCLGNAKHLIIITLLSHVFVLV